MTRVTFWVEAFRATALVKPRRSTSAGTSVFRLGNTNDMTAP